MDSTRRFDGAERQKAMNRNNRENLQVVFGSGPLGLSVVDELVRRGQAVRVVNRSGKADVPAGVEVTAADIYDRLAARNAARGAAVVYQCAQPPYHKWVELFPALQGNILDAAADAGARLVVGGNLYVYGAVEGAIHEGLPYRAHTRKGKIRAQVDEAVLAAHRSGKVQAVIGRGSDFFGPRVTGSTAGERMFLPALRGKAASVVGNPDLPHTHTYIEDFGRALVVLGERDEAPGQDWIVPSAETVSTRELVKLIFEAAGNPLKISAMGKWMMALGGLFIPEARESVEMMYEFERPFIADSSKFTRTFGLQATPLPEAVQKTVAWYRQHSR